MNAEATQPEKSTRQSDMTFLSDGHTLRGTLFHPKVRARAAVVMHGATGVPQRYYRHFARWLAEEEGLLCLTYDYRDFGASATRPMKQSKATMADWGVRDQSAAMEALKTHAPDLPVWVIGHSLGAFMLSFHQNARNIERAIAVASGPVHWRDHPSSYLPQVFLFWFALGPLATKLKGYLPGKALRLGADLPRGVYWQWRRWCTTKGFFRAELGQDLPMPDWYAVRARMTFVAIADDVMIPPKAVWRLMQFYPAARKAQLTIVPKDFGLSKVGHLGAFAKANAALWPALLAERHNPSASSIRST